MLFSQVAKKEKTYALAMADLHWFVRLLRQLGIFIRLELFLLELDVERKTCQHFTLVSQSTAIGLMAKCTSLDLKKKTIHFEKFLQIFQ